MIRLYAVNILPLRDEACFTRCYLHSSEERREKADAFQMPGDKARCIAAGLLLEYAYKKFRIEKTKELAGANSFGYVQKPEVFPEEMPKITEGLRGKPEFAWPEDEGAKFYFNLSHSGNYVICVLADYEVGADVQRRTRVRETVVSRFFSEEERMRIELCGDDVQLLEVTFAQIWTPKEAEAKLTGRGIGQMVSQMLGNEESDSLMIWQGMLEEEYAWAVAAYPEATDGKQEGMEVIIVDGGELFYEGKF